MIPRILARPFETKPTSTGRNTVRLYETTFVLNPQADEAALDNQVKAIGTIITGNGGKIVAEDRMGTRRLAYEINGMMQGYYSSFLFESEPKVLPMLERHYKLEDPYVRHLTILFEGDPEIVRERQQAMATAMEANERARRHARSEGRGGGGGYHRRDEGPRRPSYRDRERDSSSRPSAPAAEKTEAAGNASPKEAPSVDASPKETPANSETQNKSQAPATSQSPSATKPTAEDKPSGSSSEAEEL